MWLSDLRLIDTLSGGSAVGAIEVVNGVVNQFADHPPARSEIVGLRGAFVLPGLISCHTHLQAVYPYEARSESEPPRVTLTRASGQAKRTLIAGITTVRCLHEQHAVDILVRDAVNAGRVIGPRILGAGRALTTAGGHGDGLGCRVADGHDGFLAAGTAELRGGADHLKIFATGGLARPGEDINEPQMTLDEMRGAVDAAAQFNTYVAAHAASSLAIRQGLTAGIRSFEHAYRLDRETAAMMASAGARLGATLVVTHSPDWMRRVGFDELAVERSEDAAEEHNSSIRRAIEAGVTLVNATDFPPGAMDEGVPLAVREMELEVRAGLSPIDAIRGATLHAAALLGRPALGRTQLGSPADLIAVDGNPLDDIHAMRRMTMVMRHGTVIRHERPSSSG